MRLKAFMIGSVPMALDEMQLAPAMLAAAVRERGHEFQYADINLELFEHCWRNKTEYFERVESLQDYTKTALDDTIIQQWQNSILDRLQDQDVFLVNVFSVFSQIPAYRLITAVRAKYPKIKILVGGIGSHKNMFGAVHEHNQSWISQHFEKTTSHEFGSLLLENKLIDAWQSDVSMTVLDSVFPKLPTFNYSKLVDFTDYKIKDYQWNNGVTRIPLLGSHGCVRQCSFCDVIVHFNRYEFVEADELTKQIVAVYQETGVSRIQFMDSLVNGSMTNFLTLLKNLAQARKRGWLPPDFSWSGTYICRPPSSLLNDIHHALQDSGAETLVIGVETGSDRVRFEMEKKFTNNDLLHELHAFQQAGVKASLLFFPAWPTETQQDFDNTLSLLRQLVPFVHQGTVNSISMGTSGFNLIDGTPVYRNREKFGIESGPTPFLWRCNQNPDLDFWEAMRRRLLVAQYSRALGLPVDEEAGFLRFLYYVLKNNTDVISAYTGRDRFAIVQPTLGSELWSTVSQHVITTQWINSGSDPVLLDIDLGTQTYQHWLQPGANTFEWTWDRGIDQAMIKISLEFNPQYCAKLSQHANGDYYATNGVYMHEFVVDHRDITLHGFNEITHLQWKQSERVALSVDQHTNHRCIVDDTVLTISIPKNVSFQEHISRHQHPDKFAEVDWELNHVCELINADKFSSSSPAPLQ